MSKYLFLIAFVLSVAALTAYSFHDAAIKYSEDANAGGFGISPPHIELQSDPGRASKHKITVMRNKGEGRKSLNFQVDSPEMEKWITAGSGGQLYFENGELSKEVEFTISIPADAMSANYEGLINFSLGDAKKRKGVGIALGAACTLSIKVGGGMPVSALPAMGDDMYKRVRGMFVLNTGDKGKAYYVHPIIQKMYYLDPSSAMGALKENSVAISQEKLDALSVADKGDPDLQLKAKYAGKILVGIGKHEEMWYFCPVDLKLYLIRNFKDIEDVIRRNGIGITGSDFNKLANIKVK